MKDRLTKTAYLSYLECPQEFWLDYHQPSEEATVVSLEHEHLRQQGYAVERYVKELERFQSNDTIAVDFQRTFQTAEFLVRSDIVVTNRADNSIEIYEIKAASKVKDEHYDDVAFQKMVAQMSGSTVTGCYVITMNGEYVRDGEVDPEQLFIITAVDAEVELRSEKTIEQARDAIAYLDSVPVASLLDFCAKNKLDCRFIKLHYPGLPDYTIFDIGRLSNEKRRALLNDGIIDINDVPDDFDLSKKQRMQVTAAKSGETIIDHAAIHKRIDSWKYPLRFLDYETFAYAVPQFDGVRPFQQMCFQYSLHTIDSPGAEPEHSYFLSRGDDDPARAMAAHLEKAIEDEIGTVLVWYEQFEKGRNTEMAEMFPEFREFFELVNENTVDLMKIFSDHLYVHPEFRGRSSIKKVLPVLRPELNYGALGIGDGLTATIKWFRAATWDTMPAEEREQIFTDLITYCNMDTWAMVEIYYELLHCLETRQS